MGRFSVRPFVHLFVHSFVCPPSGPSSQAWGLRPSQLCLTPSQPCLTPSQPASQASGFRHGWLGLRPGWMAQRVEWTGGQTKEQTENLTILQDFVPYRGRCPKTTPNWCNCEWCLTWLICIPTDLSVPLLQMQMVAYQAHLSHQPTELSYSCKCCLT